MSICFLKIIERWFLFLFALSSLRKSSKYSTVKLDKHVEQSPRKSKDKYSFVYLRTSKKKSSNMKNKSIIRQFLIALIYLSVIRQTLSVREKLFESIAQIQAWQMRRKMSFLCILSHLDLPFASKKIFSWWIQTMINNVEHQHEWCRKKNPEKTFPKEEEEEKNDAKKMSNMYLRKL